MLHLDDVHRTVILPNGELLPILKGITVDVNAGDHLSIVGKSGTGKSTLLNIIGLLDVPDSGTYTINGTDITTLSEGQRATLRGKSFGFIFQQFNLFNNRSILSNVAIPLLYGTQHDIRTRFRQAAQMLERVGLGDRLDDMPSQLSGGEQQRVAIARALVRRPKIILADEPTGALDPTTGTLVMDLLQEIAEEAESALIVITHDRDVAARGDRMLEIADGQLHPVDKMARMAQLSRRDIEVG